MDFYNRHFHRMVRHLDPNGMLNVPINVSTDRKCLDRYFRTNKDFQKLNVPWMCDQLILLLVNYDDTVAISSTLPFLQNHFQYVKYPFTLISQGFFGLIIIQKNATKAYYSYCRNSTLYLYKNKILSMKQIEWRHQNYNGYFGVPLTQLGKQSQCVWEAMHSVCALFPYFFKDKVPRKRKRKECNAPRQLYPKEVIQIRETESSKNQLIKTGFETNFNEADFLLNCPNLAVNALEINIPEIIATHHAIRKMSQPPNLNVLSDSNNRNISNICARSGLEHLQFNQPVEEFPVFNQNLCLENPHVVENELGLHLIKNDVIQPKNAESKPSIEQLQYSMHLKDQQIVAEQFIEQPNNMANLLEQPNQINNENQINFISQPLKRKRSGKAMKRTFKKRPIEQSSKILRNRLKKLEGELPDRPLELMAMKYIQKCMNHLPLRHAMYRNKLNIPFSALTLKTELEERKNQNDDVENEMTTSIYQAITEKIDCSNTSNNCIYQQCMNNSLPHLSLLPLAEDYLTNNSLVWRDTINEINKKLEDSLKDISHISKIDESKFEEFKQKMKQRVNHSLVANKTLISSELSGVRLSEPVILLPSPRQIDELLNGKTIIEKPIQTEVSHLNVDCIYNVPSRIQSVIAKDGLPHFLLYNTPQGDYNNLNIEKENLVVDQLKPNELKNFQDIVESVEVYPKQPIDVLQIIYSVLQQCPEKTCLMFTDLCPVRVTNRKYAISVFVELLILHQKGIVKLNQPSNFTQSSSISIELITEPLF